MSIRPMGLSPSSAAGAYLSLAAKQATHWKTTSGLAAAFAAESVPAFADAATLDATATSVTVRPDVRFQTMLGFGASITDSTAYILMTQLSKTQRAALLQQVFGPANDNMSAVRISLGGSSDFTAATQGWFHDSHNQMRLNAATLASATSITLNGSGNPLYPNMIGPVKIANMPTGTKLRVGQDDATLGEIVTTTGAVTGTGPYTVPVTALVNAHPSGAQVAEMDQGLTRWAMVREYAFLIPLLKEIIAIQPGLRVYGALWNIPSWMRTSQRNDRGTLWADAKTDLANHFVKCIQEFENQGIPIYAACPQNEPWASGASFVYYTAAQYQDLVENYVYPAMKTARLDTRVLIHDHHWQTYAASLTTALADGVLAQSNPVIGWHAYGASTQSGRAITNQYPGLEQVMTEFRTMLVDNWQTESSLMAGDAAIGAIRSGVGAVVLWNLALDENGDPSASSPGRRPAITVPRASRTGAAYTGDYYMLKHLSKVCLPGARRVYSTPKTAGSDLAGVQSVAFQNPDGSIGVFLYNNQASSATANVIDARTGQGFPVTLAGYQMSSVTWGTGAAAPMTPAANPAAVTSTTAPTTTPTVNNAVLVASDTTGNVQEVSGSYTVPSGSNRCLLVLVRGGTGAPQTMRPLYATCGGVPMRLIEYADTGALNAGTGCSIALFYLLNPPTGAVTILGRNDNPGAIGVHAMTLLNVNQTDPFGVAERSQLDAVLTSTVTMPAAGASTDLLVTGVGMRASGTLAAADGTIDEQGGAGGAKSGLHHQPASNPVVALTMPNSGSIAQVSVYAHGA